MCGGVLELVSFNNDENGFVLSGLALLLILPAMLLASSYLLIVAESGEIASIQTNAESVSATGRDVRDTVRKMKLYELRINESTLNDIAQQHEHYTGLTVNLTLDEYKVFINVRDPSGTASYENVLDLSKIPR